MRENAITLLGIVAGSLTTAAFVPQVLKTWRTRAAEGVSSAMFAILALGVGLWVIYGVLIGSAPVLCANGVTLLLVLTMLALKWRFRSAASCAAPRGFAPATRGARRS
jgi:MtN3 and saliva related transmembrane protein